MRKAADKFAPAGRDRAVRTVLDQSGWIYPCTFFRCMARIAMGAVVVRKKLDLFDGQFELSPKAYFPLLRGYPSVASTLVDQVAFELAISANAISTIRPAGEVVSAHGPATERRPALVSFSFSAMSSRSRVEYLASWLQALRNDKRCMFTAATQAQAAADWLLSRMGAESAPQAT